jgi:two-component system phosphate regulon response regulator PhoB
VSRALIVEDEPAIAELIAIHLRHAGHEVSLAATVSEARVAVDAVLPDLVVLDWMLPGGTGLELARHWRAGARTRELPILMLTARSDETDMIAGLDAGADDYLVKPFSPGELMARIRAVLRRRAPTTLAEGQLVVGPLRLDLAARRVEVDGRPVRLGPTEFRLLQHLMAHPERVHSRAQLLDRVWGDHVFIEERTVDVHVKRLRETLAPVDAGRMIETVRGVGYRLTRERPAD